MTPKKHTSTQCEKPVRANLRIYLTPAEAEARGWLCQTHMAKRLRRKPGPGQEPAGYVWQGYGAYPVFDPAHAVPMRPYRQPSKAQLAALARGRELLGTQACETPDCPERVFSDYRDGYYCSACSERLRRQACRKYMHKWLDRDWLVLDVETTGLDLDAQVIEIGIIDKQGNTLFHSLVKPTMPVPAEATAIHGLQNSDLADAPAWPDIHEQVCNLLAGRLVLAYNALFDLQLMEQTAAIHGLTVLPVRTECVMELFAWWVGEENAYGSFRWHTLSDAAAYLDVEFTDAHRALGDCKATLAIVEQLAGR